MKKIISKKDLNYLASVDSQAAKYVLKDVDDKFNQAFSNWMEGANEIFQSELPTYEGRPEEHLGFKEGKKFVKVIIMREGKPTSVFAFVDKATGNLLKAASWKAPASGARGNLFDEKGGLGRVTPYGMGYNR